MKRDVNRQQWEQINAGKVMADYNMEKQERKGSFERAERLQTFFRNTPKILDEIEAEFENQVKLDSLDLKFLFLAVALQCIRQYILTPFQERVDDKTAAKRVKKNQKEHSDRKHKLYCPTLQEIITNPVPFDAMFGSKEFDLGIGGGFSHRAKTLGHDPILGWVFGTMNICTSTLTNWQFESYHVKTGNNLRGNSLDKISLKADTKKVIGYTWDRFMSGPDGRLAVATSLLKEGIHLKSDINSKVSLPLPIISTMSPGVAKKLADYGLDMANVLTVGKQAVYAAMINSIIAMLHGLFFNIDKCSSWSLYEVKTRKVIDISGMIASASNVIFVAVSSYLGNQEAIRYLDLGGISVVLLRLITDIRFIHSIKEEFVVERYIERMELL